MTAARAAVASIAGELRSDTVDGIEYWSLADAPDAAEPAGILLLPAYDEYVVGYADRSLFTPEGFTGNPVFQNVIVRRWRDRRHLGPEGATTSRPNSSSRCRATERAELDAAIDRYRAYRG